MAKKKQRRNVPPVRARSARHHGPLDESKTSVACTVAWTMSALATLAAEVFGALALLLQPYLADSGWTRMASYLMLWIALGAGLVTLVLTPVVLRVRDEPPPRGLLVSIVLIAGLPVAVSAAVILRGIA